MSLAGEKARRAMAWLAAAGTVAAAAFGVARGPLLPALAVAAVSTAAAVALAGWTRRRPGAAAFVFWFALSLPVAKHLGGPGGWDAINADHVIVYPVDVVLAIILAGAVWDAGVRWDAGLSRAIGSRLREVATTFAPDFLAFGLILLAAAFALSAYNAPRPALVAVALYDLGRLYAAYALFRFLGKKSTAGVAAALLSVAAAQSILCLAEFLLQNNFGLWEKPGWGAFLTGAKGIKLARGFVARGGGTFEPNVTSFFLQMALPVAGAYFLAAGRWVRRLAAVAAGVLTVIALTVTFSRGGWLGAALALVVVAAAAWFGRRRLGAGVGALTLTSAAAVLAVLPVAAVLVLRGLGGDEAAAYSRVDDWRTALLVIRDHPFLGIGKGNYLEVAHLYNPWAFHYPVHNVFLYFWAEAGVLGLAGIALVVAAGFRAAVRLWPAAGCETAFALGLFGAVAGLLLRMNVAMSFVHPFVVATFVALAAAAAGRASRRV